MCLLVVLLVCNILVAFGPDEAGAWPAPRYECYCADCYTGYFVCRNRDYSCNCATCSCYDDVPAAAADKPPRSKHAYVEALRLHFYGRRSVRSDRRTPGLD